MKLDESYFGGIRKGKHGRCAAGKVYTRVIGDAKTETLMQLSLERDSISLFLKE